jgi:hypothetical protein
LKQPSLADFAWKIEAGIIVRKDVRAVIAGHPVQGFTATLGEDDGLSPRDGCAVFIVW